MERLAGLIARPIRGLVPVRDGRGALRVLIASLARGGAEAIVVDWLTEEARRGRAAELALLHDRRHAWPDPPGTILRRGSREGLEAFVRRLADRWRDDPAPVSTHLVTDDLLEILWASGVSTVPVVHNAREGWRNDAARWRAPHVPMAIACAESVRAQMIESGCAVPISTIRHRPAVGPEAFDAGIRAACRAELRIAQDVFLVGVVGAFKAQKDHARALRVLQSLRKRREAALVILGGVLDRSGLAELDRTLEEAIALGVTDHLRLPGFVPGVEPYLAACDAILNASRFEGLSIAVQEALAAGLPVIATDVGGQREIRDPLLQLVGVDADPESLAERLASLPVRATLLARPAKRMPRLWSVALSARSAGKSDLDTLFVTANLNTGGAQRSLVNLAAAIASRHRIAIAVCSETTHWAFAAALAERGIEHFRPACDADVFALAESLLATAAARGARNLCFWNASPRVKLLVAKFAPPALRLIDVSPGDYSFRELEGASDFAEAIAYPGDAYYERLDHLVLKFHSKAAAPCVRVSVIPNGVAAMPAQANAGGARILVRGRIAPSKRLEVVIAAFRELLNCVPAAQLHCVGPCEPRERAYGERILALAAGLPVWFHGAVADPGMPDLAFAATVVLGTNQGSPNAILEAMASGIPVIANASGGTAELVVDGQTGWLLEENPDAAALAGAMRAALIDPGMAAARAARARERVAGRFSLDAMVESYLRLLAPEATPVREKMAPCHSDSAPVAAPPLPSAPSPATAAR